MAAKNFIYDQPDDYKVFDKINALKSAFVVDDKYYDGFMSLSRVLACEGIVRLTYRKSEIDRARSLDAAMREHSLRQAR